MTGEFEVSQRLIKADGLVLRARNAVDGGDATGARNYAESRLTPSLEGESPSRQHSLPIRIHPLPHLRLIVPLAIRNFLVTLPTPRHLIVIQVHA